MTSTNRLDDHPTVIQIRRRRDRTVAGPAAPLDAATLRRLCLDAGADDVGFVEIDRPEIADQRADLEAALPGVKTLIGFVCRMNRENIRTPARSVANLEFHHGGDRIDETGRRVVASLEAMGVRAINPAMGFPMEMDNFPRKAWVVAHKPVAVAAGLGKMGIHRNVIHPKFGNFILLGTILIDAEVSDRSKPLDWLCQVGGVGVPRWPGEGPSDHGWVDAVAPSYQGHRFPVEIISHCVWLYHRFPLSLRDVELMMAQRGVVVTYETVHQWCRKFAQTYASGLRRRRARPGDKWHVDEVFIKIAGKTHYLWRAVDQHGAVLDILVTSRRDAKAATRFFRKLLTGMEYVPRVLVTDKLASYRVAHRRLMPGVEHRRSKYLNNRAENSHQPTRARERAMRGFRSPGGAQRFLSAFSGVSPHFRLPRHRLRAAEHRRQMNARFATWNTVVGLPTA